MKLLPATAFLVLSALLFSTVVYAQKKWTRPERCATMKRIELQLNQNLALRTADEAKAKKVVGGPVAGHYRLNDQVTIPVVVHIVLSNPYQVTDADVQAQIDRLNLDFSGLNTDSSNASGFYTVRGRSKIRFCLARRTPTGLLTSGIERRASGTGSNAEELIDPIKRTAQGGLDAWATDRYLNLWIGRDITGQGILGYANNLGPGTPDDDGVFLNIEAFGTASCYVKAPYNLGRTATHEVGHYLGLYHVWGSSGNNTCSDDDFRQLPATTNFSLPPGLYNPEGQANGAADIGDTPNQGTATFGCPNLQVTDGCSAAAPGIMFQNFMDYTNDACLTLFTAKQINRMEWVLANCRAGLLTSDGCQPPANAPQLDAAVSAPVNPGGFEYSGCRPLYYPDRLSCPTVLTPKFRVENRGQTAITSLTVGYSFDGGPAITQTVSINLPLGGVYVASFAPINVTTGSHTLRFFTANPNGGSDELTANDSYTKTFEVMAETQPPVLEGFENAAPLQSWAVDNPNFDFTWTRTTPGRAGSAGKISIDNYNNDGYRHHDDLRSTTFVVDPAAAYSLTFNLAHKNYPDPEYTDSLAVYVSRDCGQSFTRVYYKGGAALATAGSSSVDYEEPAAGDWRTESIHLTSALLTSGKIIIVIRNISGFGNRVHLDNLHLAKVGARDLHLTSISNPGTNACSTTVVPSVSIENIGLEAVTSFSVGYRVDNGPVQQQFFTQTIASGATLTVSLPQATATTGAHTITAFTFNPSSASGSGDLRVFNDTLQKSFTVVRLLPATLSEGFETAFPPQGWTITNPDNNATWIRRSPGKATRYSAFIDNYNNNLLGETDDIRTPFLDVAGADSVIVTFDVAHKFFPALFGSSNDRLTVLSTTTCGNNYAAVYSKAGTVLASAGSTEDEYLLPGPNDWRNERIVLGATATASGHLALAFRNTNNFGNNIFIDNISIAAVYKRDLQLLTVQQPGNFVCTPTVSPAIRVRNEGTEIVQGFTVTYTLNNGAPQTHTATGLSLARGAEATVSLPALAGLTAGSYNLRIVNTALVTASGTVDQNAKNDTLQQIFSVPGRVTAPLTESFTSTVFPPANWSVLNGNGNTLWKRYPTSNGAEGSAFVQNFTVSPLGQKVDLISPIIDYEKADSVRLSFDMAAAPYTYATSPGSLMDTLEVVLTKDCGASFTTVYKKWGEELKTAGDPFAPQATEFFPQMPSHWRRETIDLTQFAAQSPVLLFFRVTNNNENNLFVDNVNFSTRILPAKLKEQGFLVYPSPFRTSFVVWHYEQPTGLRYIRVMNAAGQVIWSRQFIGNADKQVPINITGQAAGVYLVEMGYSNGQKPVVQKVLKQ